MAARYPIVTGGASNTTATWATSSGQVTGGASIPVSGDSVICDATMVGNLVWTGTQSFDTLDCTGCVGTMSGSGALNILGDTFKLNAGMTYTATGTVTFTGANAAGDVTLTRAGKTSNQTYAINAPGKTVKLADAHNLGTGTINVINGTFNSQTFDISCGDFGSNNTNTRTITLTGSTMTISNTFGTIDPTNLTFAGPTLLRIARAGATTVQSLIAGGVTLPSVEVRRDVTGPFIGFALTASSGTLAIGALSFAGTPSAGFRSCVIQLPNNVTIDECAFPEGTEISSTVSGTQRTITTNTNEISFDQCMIRDIAISGGPAYATNSIDLGNNSGITFQNVGPYTHEINGFTYDDNGAVLGGVTCVCYEDSAPTVVVSTTTSNAMTGAYTLQTANGNAHTVVWTKGSANRGDAMRGIIPTPA